MLICGGGQFEAKASLENEIQNLNTKIDNKTNIKDYNSGADVQFGCSTPGMNTTN